MCYADIRRVSTDKVTVHILEAPEFLHMLIVNIYTVTCAMHDHSSGKPHLPLRSALPHLIDWQQQLKQEKVPAYHEQCCEMLGLAGLSSNNLPSSRVVVQHPATSAGCLCAVSGVLGHQLYRASSSSNSQLQKELPCAPELLLPQQRVVLELLLLNPSSDLALQGFGMYGVLFDILVPDANDVTDAVVGMAAAVGPGAVKDLASDVVLYLAPLMLQFIRVNTAAAAQVTAAPTAAASRSGWSAADAAAGATYVTQLFTVMMQGCLALNGECTGDIVHCRTANSIHELGDILIPLSNALHVV